MASLRRKTVAHQLGNRETSLEAGTSFDAVDPGREMRELGERDAGPAGGADP